MDGITVVVPAYNEEGAIREEISRLARAMESHTGAYEIVVVDDGSTDETGRILDAADLDIRVIHHPRNRGYGAALKTGLRNARYELIAITDADGTYPHEMIPTLAADARDFDMVVGARTNTGVRVPLIRRPAKWAITQLANYLAEYDIPDLNSGLRVMRRSVTEKYLSLLPDGFSFTTTITLAMLVNGHTIKYVGIDYMARTGRSKIRPIRDTLNFAQLIVRTVMYFRPLKVFVPASLLLLSVGVGVFFYSYFFTAKIMDATVVACFLAAIQVLATGMIADLIDKRVPPR